MSETRATRNAPDGLILAMACVAQFMVVLDISIVNIALPSIQRDLHFSHTGVQWVVNAYVLTFAGFLLLGGRAADLFGRRRVYLTGLALFTLASIAAGFATSSGELTGVRAVQGIGGAILSPTTLTIIVTTFRGPKLPRAIGMWSAVAGAGGAVGVLLGGILVGEISWRWIFFINVPIGVFAGVVAVLYLQEMRNPGSASRLDVTGAALVTASLAALVYGIVNTASVGWTSTTTISWFAGALVGLLAFALWETYVASNPLLPWRVFASRSLVGASLSIMFVGAAFFAMWYFLSFYVQDVLGYGALKAGFAFAPMAVGIIIGAQISSRVIQRVGVRAPAFVGTVIATGGFYWLGQIPPRAGYATVVLPAATLCAFAIGLLFTPLATAATSHIDRADAGLASGVLNTARQIGGSLGLAALATVAVSRSAQFAHPDSAAALTAGYQRAFVASAAIFAASFLAVWIIPGKTGRAAALPGPERASALTPVPEAT
jgi:EmrB/QacA subfamily drug resistance transporter